MWKNDNRYSREDNKDKGSHGTAFSVFRDVLVAEMADVMEHMESSNDVDND